MHPAINKPIINKLSSLSAVKMSSYLPRISKIKAPDIPGKIIAQIASAPLNTIIIGESEVWAGVRLVTP